MTTIQENTKKQLAFSGRLLLAFCIAFVTFYILYVVDNALNLNIITPRTYGHYFMGLLIMTMIILIKPLKREFQLQFNHVSRNMIGYILLSIFLGILLNFLLSIYRYVPFLLGENNIIPVGGNQLTSSNSPVLSELGFLMQTNLIAPFVETLIFQFLFLAAFMFLFYL